MTVEYLRELIEKNARVIIPDFGAFLVKDDGTGIFKPENVSFSPFLRYNDGMMVDSLSKKMSISRDESSKSIKSFTEIIKDKLLNNNEFEINGLGFLYRDNRGGVHFQAISYTNKSSKVTDNEAEKQKPEPKPTKTDKTEKIEKTEQKVAVEKKVEEKKEVEKTNQPEPVKEVIEKTDTKKEEVIADVVAEKNKEKPVQLKNQKSQLITDTPKKSEPKPTKQVKSEPVDSGTGKAILIGSLIGIALIAIVAGGLYLNNQGFFDFSTEVENVDESSDNLRTDKVETDESSPVEVAKEEKGKFDDEFEKLSKEMDTKIKETVEENPKEEVPEQATKTDKADTENIPKDIIPTSDGPYHLIVGSFRNPEYAEKFSADMRKSGYSSTVVIQSSGMHSVTLGSYSTRADAIKAMDIFKSQHPNVWLLEQ